MDASEDRPIAGVISNETTFLEIVDRECILFAYTMANDGKVFSDSLTTVTFEDVVGGTRLTLVEQMSILGGSDDISSRKNGWAWLLDNIEKAQAEVDA